MERLLYPASFTRGNLTRLNGWRRIYTLHFLKKKSICQFQILSHKKISFTTKIMIFQKYRKFWPLEIAFSIPIFWAENVTFKKDPTYYFEKKFHRHLNFNLQTISTRVLWHFKHVLNPLPPCHFFLKIQLILQTAKDCFKDTRHICTFLLLKIRLILQTTKDCLKDKHHTYVIFFLLKFDYFCQREKLF